MLIFELPNLCQLLKIKKKSKDCVKKKNGEMWRWSLHTHKFNEVEKRLCTIKISKLKMDKLTHTLHTYTYTHDTVTQNLT